MVHQETLQFQSRGRGTTDITKRIDSVVSGSRVRTGACTVFLQHTSASLVITENADPDVREDLETILSRLAPDADPDFRHDAEGEDDMAAHARSVLTSSGFTIPVGGSHLLLGAWQGLFLWEHRTSPQTRSVIVTVMGE